jgi:ATP-dependent Lon protease
MPSTSLGRGHPLKLLEISQVSKDQSLSVVGASNDLPILAVRDTVVFPGNIIPIPDISSLGAKDRRLAYAGNLRFGIVTLREEPDGVDRLYPIGTEVVVVSVLKLPDGRDGALVKGERKFIMRKLHRRRTGLSARVSFLEDRPAPQGARARALLRAIKNDLMRGMRANQSIPEDTISTIQYSQDPDVVCNLVIPHLSLNLVQRLELLSIHSQYQRMKLVHAALQQEIDLNKLSERLQKSVDGDLQEMHRRNFIKEQIRVLKTELGEMEGLASDLDRLEESVAKLDAPVKVKQALSEELERLAMVPPGTPEYFVAFNYVQFLLDLPWQLETRKPVVWRRAVQTMNRGHFGQEKVKERILEFLAVMKHCDRLPGQILLLDGPPGVGKTSFARSIADALQRPFIRVALGGVKDEAEIRGHRRTYIGSMPGKILQAIRQARVLDPVILLDEIDKLGTDQGQNVEAALLELLDREQNQEFVDHFLGVPFDLSNVLFIATSNDSTRLSSPLRDRMEEVQVPGYSDREKTLIAKKFMIPEVRTKMMLNARQFNINESALSALVHSYTRESGVRQLHRSIETLGRKSLRTLVENRRMKRVGSINIATLEKWLGPPLFPDSRSHSATPGYVTGLAYTEFGGELMPIEVNVLPRAVVGCPTQVTGSLGGTLKESVMAAWSHIVSRLSAAPGWVDYLSAISIHVHFPDAGTPKDGPSAGMAIALGMLSALTKIAVPMDIAMTGEISIRGDVLPVGGIRDKVLAATRAGKKLVYLPALNRGDASQIDSSDLGKTELRFIANFDQILLEVQMTALPKVPVGALGIHSMQHQMRQLNSLVPGQV